MLQILPVWAGSFETLILQSHRNGGRGQGGAGGGAAHDAAQRNLRLLLISSINFDAEKILKRSKKEGAP